MNTFIVFKRKHNNKKTKKTYKDYFLYVTDCNNRMTELEFGKPYILKSVSIESRPSNGTTSKTSKTSKKNIEYLVSNFYSIEDMMIEFDLDIFYKYFNDYFEYELI